MIGLSYPHPKNEQEEALNAHALEDASHFSFFINDCKELLKEKKSLDGWILYQWDKKFEVYMIHSSYTYVIVITVIATSSSTVVYVIIRP